MATFDNKKKADEILSLFSSLSDSDKRLLLLEITKEKFNSGDNEITTTL